MIEVIGTVAVYVLTTAAIVVIHELGHYLTGLAVGIPARRMSIRLQLFSGPHVALRDDSGNRVSPSEFDRYVRLLEGFVDTDAKMFLFVAGGHALETVFIVLVVFVTETSAVPRLGWLAGIVTWMGLLFALIYLATEVWAARRGETPSGGDISGLWAIAPVPSVVFYGCCFTAIVAAFAIVRV